MEKFESLLDHLEKIGGIDPAVKTELQRRIVACRSEFNIENRAKNDAMIKNDVLLKLTDNLFKHLVSRANMGDR